MFNPQQHFYYIDTMLVTAIVNKNCISVTIITLLLQSCTISNIFLVSFHALQICFYRLDTLSIRAVIIIFARTSI